MIAYLVIRADQSMRIAKRPRLSQDEVAVKLNIQFPPNWGTVIGEATVLVPNLVTKVEPVDPR